MIGFEFLARKTQTTQTHQDIEFFYVMDGVARFTLADKQYTLKRDDFLVINVDKSHSYTADGDFLAASMHISYGELSKLLKKNVIFFWCNTAVDNNEACDEIRRIFLRITAEQYNNKGENAIFLTSLYYEFLNVLISDFLLNQSDRQFNEETRKFDARKHQIQEYIRTNFDKQISLEDLAGHLFLSYAYLSKYIKRTFGMGFAEYLNSVRLSYAVSQLLHSDQSVVRIAMESGFASSAALNKAFREKFSMTPTEYRKQRAGRAETTVNSEDEERTVRETLDRHFERSGRQDRTGRKQPEENIIVQNGARKPLNKSWCRMINVGSALDLLQSDMQAHVLTLKEELKFEYVRFWDLFDPELMLNGKDGSCNFEKLDRVLDFLFKNGLKPYIELRNKPKKVLSNAENLLMFKDNPVDSDPERIEQFMRKLMIHLLNRYHTGNVETWYFELWHAEPEQVLLQTGLAEKIMPYGKYLDWFNLVAGVLREYLPTVQIGGGGFSLRYGEEALRNLLDQWKLQPQTPNFLSVYCYPYSLDSIDKSRNQSKNADFLRDNLTTIRRLMEETAFPTDQLHVSEWSFSVSNRNPLNDHCMKGAYLVSNIIDCMDLADIVGFWLGSDLYASYYDATSVLNGSGGLLSKDGVRKPAFFAFEFMNHLGKYVRKRSRHCIVTENGTGNWRIVCHNLKPLSHQYGLQQEDQFRPNELNNLFTDMKKCRLHFELPGKRGGKYTLRIHSVNRFHGSVQDEWLAMSAPEELSRADLRYLGRITTPHMVIQSLDCDNGKIIFDLTLEPNEIAYVHVTYQYS